MPVLFWIEVALCATTLVMGLAAALTALAQASRRRLNQLLAGDLVLLSAWAGAALTLRLLLWLDAGRPSTWLQVATVALGGAAILLPAVISRYLKVPPRTSDLVAISGTLGLILAAVPVFGGVLLAEPTLTPAGTVAYDVLPGGYVASLVSAACLVWGLLLLWHQRDRRPVGRLGMAVTLILVGYVVGGVLRPFLPIPFLTVAVTLAVGSLAFQVVAEQVFSPTPKRISELEKMVRKREGELAEARVRLEAASAELAERTTHLEAASAIAREAAGIHDIERLLQETVQLISERFGFYHAGVFLLDETGDYVVLRAASSAGGRRMLERGHRLRIGEEGIVGRVAALGQARLALDVGADAVFFDNPDLSETRSEVALPLVARGKTIGALDVQSRKPAAFGDEDVGVLQTLADQVAIAIMNARLLRQAQEALEREQQARGRVTRQAWQRLLSSEQDLSVRYDPQGILAGDEPWRDTVLQVLEEGRAAVGEGSGRESVAKTTNLVVPIVLRGQVIGVLDAHKAQNRADADSWSGKEIELLESLSHQLAVALESARLHRDTQRLAARERLVSDVAAEMRESLDLVTVLKTGARGIREAMGLPAVTVRLVDQEVESEREAQ